MSNFNMFARGGGYVQPSVSLTPQQQLWQHHIQSLRTIDLLPGGFPSSPPVVEVLPPCRHNWIDQQMRVVGCDAINNWHMHRNLGEAINSIRAELYNHPPVLLPNNFGVSGDAVGGPSGSDTTSARDGRDSNGQTRSSVAGVPPLPSEFPQLDAMSNEELQDLASDDAAFVMFFNTLPHVTALETLEKNLREENLRLAQKNLDQEPVLEGLKQTLIEKHELLAVQKREYDDLVEKQRQLAEKFTPQAIANHLEQAYKTCEREAQALAQDFQAGKETDVDNFVERYKQISMQYHLRKIKTKKLAELAR